MGSVRYGCQGAVPPFGFERPLPTTHSRKGGEPLLNFYGLRDNLLFLCVLVDPRQSWSCLPRTGKRCPVGSRGGRPPMRWLRAHGLFFCPAMDSRTLRSPARLASLTTRLGSGAGCRAAKCDPNTIGSRWGHLALVFCWMLWLLLIPLRALPGLRRSHRDLALENLALHHQLHVALRTNPRPRLRHSDRIFWVWLRRLWPSGWRLHLAMVRPETVIGWHRKGLAAVLDSAVAQPPRSAPAPTRGPPADRHDVARQPSVGNRAHPGRAAQARRGREQSIHPALSLAQCGPGIGTGRVGAPS
jgi:hypothetical protein